MKVDESGKLIAETDADKVALNEVVLEIESLEAAEESMCRQTAILGLRRQKALAILSRMLYDMEKKVAVIYDRYSGAFYRTYDWKEKKEE